MKSEARDFQPYEDYDKNAEPWRQALEKEYENIRNNHYSGIGSFSVYGSTIDGKVKVIACLESHRYSPKNYWNGRWRTMWSMEIENDSCVVYGQLKVQVHYFEDGNVQLVTTKEFEDKVKATVIAYFLAKFYFKFIFFRLLRKLQKLSAVSSLTLKPDIRLLCLKIIKQWERQHSKLFAVNCLLPEQKLNGRRLLVTK